MSRVCSICRHPERAEIERILVNRSASYRDIAGRFALSKTAVSRHVNAGHIAERLALAHQAEQVAEANKLLSRVQEMTERMEAWIERAERSYEYKEVRAFAAEWRQQIELLAKLAGQLQQEGTTNVFLSAEWIQVEAAIVQALEPFPEAKRAVVRALPGEAGSGGSNGNGRR